MPLDHVIADAVAALQRASTVVGACRAVLDAIGRHTDVMGAVLLPVHDYLRCAAATGSWQVFATVAPGHGVVGRVYATGRSAVIDDTADDPDYIALGAGAQIEICVPVVDAGGTIGAMNLEWITSVDTAEWRSAAEEIGRRLGDRIAALGGPPAESRSEKLLRHALALTTASNDEDLLARSLRAARDVSGLATQIILLTEPGGIEINIDEERPTELGRRIAAVDPAALAGFITRAHRYGASYSLGDPADHNAASFETLTRLGVRTLIAVPVGRAPQPGVRGGVLLAADEVVTRPDAELVNLLELLSAQAWSTLERLQTLDSLRERATSDPLTGLRHHGSFGERLASARPGRTAVFTIDIDGFKAVNDTYGHQAGDRALVELARSLTSALRTEDELFRIGGDEFAAVVDVARHEEALRVADRLVSAARHVGRTISVGVAIQHVGETSDQTLGRADAALYLAKRNGRDGVRLAV